MTTYDPNVIQYYADRLYAQASGAAVVGLILGAFFGVMVGALIAYGSTHMTVVMMLMALSFAVCGLTIGRAQARSLRERAQLAICQLEIEKNTRTL